MALNFNRKFSDDYWIKVNLALVTWVLPSLLPIAQLLGHKRIKEWRPDSHCQPRKRNTLLQQEKELAIGEASSLQLIRWIHGLELYTSFSCLQTPRWHVFSKWAILADVYMDLFTEILLFLFFALSLSHKERVYLNASVGRLKWNPHLQNPPCTFHLQLEYLQSEPLAAWPLISYPPGLALPPSLGSLSLSYTVRLPLSLTSGSVTCTGWEFLRCPQIFESSSPRGSARPW